MEALYKKFFALVEKHKKLRAVKDTWTHEDWNNFQQREIHQQHEIQFFRQTYQLEEDIANALKARSNELTTLIESYSKAVSDLSGTSSSEFCDDADIEECRVEAMTARKALYDYLDQNNLLS